ncbi:MAG: hypothetical protein HOQ17_16670 [Gemmatimonadaceae bacterium]|nr:hypothetical protein [Gemmatimonadaceae bacterium]NUO95505.1 hypothetical protein [Gemmatimonadaceae bacterium]NUP55413.1 hypothetical protein [Gemmatimonadaceae bacterium]NUS34681.1 hypothetical protein [Gemmatimonadaceae bacterium]NUS48852.1 hypothetical protein [Gemmatimonadaceae bacterium]
MFGLRGRRWVGRGTARAAIVAATLLAMIGGRLGAQDSSAVKRQGWIIGGSLGMLGSGREAAPLELTTVGMSFTQVAPGGLGADIAIGTIPRTLAAGVVVLGARFDATVPLSIAPGVLLLPAAGLTLVGGAAEGGGGGTAGYNLGAAAVLGTGTVGFRTGVTWHRLPDIRSGIWLLEVGIARLPGVAPR